MVCTHWEHSDNEKDTADISSDEEDRGDGNETRSRSLESDEASEYLGNLSFPRKFAESTGFLKVTVILFGY